MHKNSFDRLGVFRTNPGPRLPVTILVDSSFSMNGVTGGEPTGGEQFFKDGKMWTPVKGGETRMKRALSAIKSFAEEIQADRRAFSAVEMSVVSFDTNVKIEQDFEPVSDRTKNLPIHVGKGDETNLGRGVKTALALLNRRKKEYSDQEIQYYQPQLIILTDGAATDPDICNCLLYTSPSPRDRTRSRMPSSA